MRKVTAHNNLHNDALDAMAKNQSLFVTIPGTPYDRTRYGGDPALLMLTSGSTGKSKIVVIPWTAVEFRLGSVLEVHGPDMEHTMLLSLDKRNYFYARELTMAAGRYTNVTHDIKEATCAIFFGKERIPFNERLQGAENLRLIISCGYLLTNAQWHELKTLAPQAKVITRYGITEVGSITYTNGEEVKDGNVGKPYPGVEVRVDFGTGEIQVKTPGMASGYIGREFLITTDGWYCTGDTGHIDAEGNLHITGTAKPGRMIPDKL